MIACAARMVGSKVIFFSFLLYSHSQYINIFPSKEKRACLKLWDTHKQYHPPNFQTKHHFQVYTCTLKKRILTIPLKQTLLFKDFTLPGRRGVYSPLLAKYLLTPPPPSRLPQQTFIPTTIAPTALEFQQFFASANKMPS